MFKMMSKFQLPDLKRSWSPKTVRDMPGVVVLQPQIGHNAGLQAPISVGAGEGTPHGTWQVGGASHAWTSRASTGEEGARG